MNILLILVLPVLVFSTDSTDTPSGRPERIRRHMSILAADSMQGREIGSKGEELAASYIESQFNRIGLRQPYPASSYPTFSYRQNFLLHGGYPSPRTHCSVWHGKTETALTLWKEYFPFTTGPQTYLPKPVRLVFVGYGITAPEYRYDDYRGVDTRNTVVVFLAGEPPSAREEFFDGARSTRYSFQSMKQANALVHGARGCIMIDGDDESDSGRWNDIVQEYKSEIVMAMKQQIATFSISLSRDAAAVLFKKAPHSFGDVLDFRMVGAMRSFPLDAAISFNGQFRERDFRSANIIGILDGADPLLSDTCIIVSAHYDHLGMRAPVGGDSIYNGAFDNAAGVAALIDIAARMKETDYRPRRTIVFACVTGEEKGFLGSRAYINDPPFPLAVTACNLNIDGLAMFDSLQEVVVLGDVYSTFGEVLDPILKSCGLARVPVPENLTQDAPFFNSDQAAFAQAGIPSAMIIEGTGHRTMGRTESLRLLVDWGRSHYHKPSDDMHQRMNLRAAAFHVDVLERCIRVLADTPAPPVWYPGTSLFHTQ